MESPISYFSSLTDPRVERTREHSLEDILFYYCPVKNGIGKKVMLNGCKIAVEYCFFKVQAPL
jgi:hypothetical protein